MLTINEYILMRKQKDKLNEFDLERKSKNIKKCVDYIFDYFDDYIIHYEKEAKKRVDTEKVEKYRNRLSEFSPDVREWLVNLYSQYNNMLNILLKNILEKCDYFLLYNTEEQFEALCNECISKLTYKCPYIVKEMAGVLKFIKEYHQMLLNDNTMNLDYDLPENIITWVNNTKDIYNIDLLAFSNNWTGKAIFNPSLYPKMYKDNHGVYIYETDFFKQKNLLGIDKMYTELCTKPFIANHKQELLTILICSWINCFKSENAWKNYLDYYTSELNLKY